MTKKYRIVSFSDKGSGVIAQRKILRDELVCTSYPVKLDVERDTHSIQISEDRHVYIDEPGILFNHSCEPNLRVSPFDDGRCNFYAIRDIEIGEELVWHYGMTEAYSIAVTECKCAAPSCFGKSVGFKEAPLSIQKKLYDWGCATYLKDWFEERIDQTKSKSLEIV